MGVQIGHRGGRWIELCVARPPGDGPRFHDAAHALRYLRERADASEVRRMRALLPGGEWPTARLDDAAVLRRVAEGLVARTLFLRFERDPTRAWAEAPAVEVPESGSPLVWTPGPDRAAEAPPRRPQLPEFAAPTDWEQAVQARTLRLAARDGRPFCAVCRRKPRAPAAAVAAPVAGEPRAPEVVAVTAVAAPERDATLPASLDAVAQARALVRAARDGVPFCAVCVGR